MDIGPILHDPLMCGLSPETSCPKCKPSAQRYQARFAQGERLKRLRERMEKADIDLDDLADIMWMKIQLSIEKEVKEIMDRVIAAALSDLRVIGRIESVQRR